MTKNQKPMRLTPRGRRVKAMLTHAGWIVLAAAITTACLGLATVALAAWIAGPR